MQPFIFNLNIPRQCIDINQKLSSKYAIRLMIFSSVWKTILKFVFENRKHAFFTIHRTVSSQCIKMYKFFLPYFELALHCSLSMLWFQAQSVLITHWHVVVVEWLLCTPGQDGPLDRVDLPPWWCGVGSWLCVGHAWFRASALFLKMSKGLSYEFTEISVNCE